MIVVIQCAATMRPGAGTLRGRDGERILFVADPSAAPAGEGYAYARPDDVREDSRSWRAELLTYNDAGTNPLGLLPAIELYENPAYRQLASRIGMENVFILSAGWGLIRSEFLTPLYDITFSSQVKKKAPWKLRRRNDRYSDFRQLPMHASEPVFFLGGKDYVPLFCKLTEGVRAPRTVIYNSEVPPAAPGCTLQRFNTSTKTNWRYEGARWLMSVA